MCAAQLRKEKRQLRTELANQDITLLTAKKQMASLREDHELLQKEHEVSSYEHDQELHRLQQQIREISDSSRSAVLKPFRAEVKQLKRSINALVDQEGKLCMKKHTLAGVLKKMRNSVKTTSSIARLSKRIKQFQKKLHVQNNKPRIAGLRADLEKWRDKAIYFEKNASSLQEEKEDAHAAHKALNETGQTVVEAVQDLVDADRRKNKPYEMRFVKMAMTMMGNGVPASRVSMNIDAVLKFLGIEVPKRNWPSRPCYGYWRYSMAFVCKAQIGYELTKAAREGVRGLSLTSDGSPVQGFHVEGVIIKIGDLSISMLPKVLGSKAADVTSECIITSFDECQAVFNLICEKLTSPTRTSPQPKPLPSAIPKPLPLGAFLLLFDTTNHDHASNEGLKAANLSKAKTELAVRHKDNWRSFGFNSLSEYKKYAMCELFHFNCTNHKGMLLAKAIREADHGALAASLPAQRDTGEFRTSNLMDMLQLQIAKMFGHTKNSYAFGHGVLKFRAWMLSRYPTHWKGIKRLVGNRAQIFLENALCMYHMSTFYEEYCEYVILKVIRTHVHA